MQSTSSITSIVNPFTVGFNESNTCCWFRGTIDEVAIYDRPLTVAEIDAHYRAGMGL